MINNYFILNVYDKKNISSKLVSQLIYGEKFKTIKKYKNWLKIKCINDNYIGYIKKRKFEPYFAPTHKINKLFTYLHKRPNKISKMKKKISFGSKIKIIEKKNNFYKFDNYWVKKKDTDLINISYKKIFLKIKNFNGVKYKWGGRSFNGLDCSALVQLFFNFNNKFCPRDTKDQIKYFKKKVNIRNIKKNDLIFWKGHVAITLSRNKLIHAYGPLKKVVIMNISKTIKRIENTAKLKVIGIRRT